MKMFKAILFLMVIVGLFAAGYYLGSRQTGQLKTDLKQGREEMSEKAAGLEKEIRLLRLRLNLYSVGRHLASAEAALAERNYGTAKDELQQAKKAAADAADLSDAARQKTLARFGEKLDAVIEDADDPDPGLVKRLNGLRAEWDQITG